MNKHVFNLAFLAFLLVSCQPKLQELPDKEVFVSPVIKAETETQSDTRTSLSDSGTQGTISWQQGDEINVFFGTARTHYITENSGTTATFSTTDLILDTDDTENVWGLYPYNANATCNGSAVRTTLPAAQHGVAGTFDDDLFIMLAHNNTNSLQFKNVCGGVKFSLDRNDITSVTFKGNNNEDIAGDISLAFQNGNPAVTVVNGLKEITLTPKTGSTFTSGVNYYIAVLPVTLSRGFTMKFRTSGGQVGTLRRDSSPVTISRSAFSKKDNITSNLTFRNEYSYSKVLFIGNSITLVPPSSSVGWYGNWGMAATREQYDYVHRVMARLRENNASVTYSISGMNVPGQGIWETSPDFTHPSVSPLYALTQYTQVLDANTDLVIIRLGENVQDKTNFENALVVLIRDVIQVVAPSAKIIMTGLFWSDAQKEAAIVNAASRTNVTYVEIDQYDTPEYKETVDGVSYDIYGNAYFLTNAAVAAHPSDLGMEMIAKEILDAIL
jgi:hypothetical protein